jgi:hypothetical protein
MIAIADKAAERHPPVSAATSREPLLSPNTSSRLTSSFYTRAAPARE